MSQLERNRAHWLSPPLQRNDRRVPVIQAKPPRAHWKGCDEVTAWMTGAGSAMTARLQVFNSGPTRQSFGLAASTGQKS